MYKNSKEIFDLLNKQRKWKCFPINKLLFNLIAEFNFIILIFINKQKQYLYDKYGEYAR